jgi:hypothetical protein
MSCGAAGPLFRGTACLDFGVKPKGARPPYVWEHVALNLGFCSSAVTSHIGGCLLHFLSLSFSWFCLGFAVAFLVEQRGGGLLVCGCAGQSMRFFLPCGFVLSFPYFFLAEAIVVFLLFFDRGFICGTH